MIFFSASLRLLIASSLFINAHATKEPMSKAWFKNTACKSLEIKKFKSTSDERIVSALKLTDPAALQDFVKRISQIPADGDKMKSFGDEAEHIELAFECAPGELQKIDIYNKRFKTPSTGFNSSENTFEASLYSDIDALLFPALDKRTLKVAGLELKFKDFSVTFVEASLREQKAGEPSIGSISTSQFLIRDKTKQEQKLSITSGQVAPQPKNFTVNGINLRLLTYETKSKETLYPTHFAVSK